MTPEIKSSQKNVPCSEGFNTHIWRDSNEIDEKMFNFRVNLGMWLPQINCLWKSSPVLRVSTHIDGVSKEIEGKIFIFRVNLSRWLLKSNHLQKIEPCSEGFNTHLWGFQWDRWKNSSIFRVNLGLWPLRSIILEKHALFWGFQHTFMGFSMR